ncbi:MAG: M23 family metallopeptidase [Saprospiraceae bacterium]|nr:M23 family metallopeptidase [Saprospiraceae bacterium]MDG2419620.1 M23 family metallopeptidase [Saprospiraceae bacterium]
MPKHQKQTSLIIIPSIFFTLTVLFCSKKNYVFAATPDQIEIATSMEKASFYPYGTQSKYDVIFEKEPNFISQQFDFPVGIPDGSNYYKAREFGQKRHLGEDWNGTGGGNTDLGDPVHSVSNGYVTFAENVCCGWGNIVRVVHKFPDHPEYPYVESFYAHLDEVKVKEGEFIRRGQLLGTIGTADGIYSAHLHLEMRNFIDMGIGPGYSDDTFGFLVPTDFIEKY